MIVDLIIPAFNEEDSICKVLGDIPKHLVREIIVVNNGSFDDTVVRAQGCGATVLHEDTKGYGSACLKGLNHLHSKQVAPDVVVFLDGDYSDHPDQLPRLLTPLKEGYDLVIGSRALGQRERNSMMPQQRFGNWLATLLIKWLHGYSYSDLGPFRAISYNSLKAINMQDTNFGWTVEMQIKAIKKGLRITEVPVDYRQRIGVSKITGTIKGTIMAGYKIIYTIFKYR